MAEIKRVQFGARIEPQYKERIKAVAKKKKTSPRTILEQIFEETLPKLEREAGIQPGEPPSQPPSSPKSK